MKYRRLGRTGIEVSEIVIGGGWVGGIMIDPDDDTKREALRLAIDAGINWIDTANDYGQGKSEEALGRLLPEIPEDRRPRLSTKVRLDLESGESLESQVERRLHQSLERLGVPWVPLYQLHNRIGPARDGQAMSVADVLGVADLFQRHRERGLIGHLGITALGAAPAIREVIASGRFDTAQVYYNMINPSAALAADAPWDGPDFRGIMDACAAHDVGVMNIRVLAAGVLATDTRHGREVPVMPEFDLAEEERRARAVLAALGEGHGTRAQAALRFALAEPRISCIVLGLATLDHLREALAGYAMGPLDAATVAAVTRTGA